LYVGVCARLLVVGAIVETCLYQSVLEDSELASVVGFFRATVGFWNFKEKLNWQKQYFL
jgi:hypothetical protein